MNVFWVTCSNNPAYQVLSANNTLLRPVCKPDFNWRVESVCFRVESGNVAKPTRGNVAIKLDGGKLLIDKAVANIEFAAIENIMGV